MVSGIGTSRPRRTPAGVRDPARPGPDHTHDVCHHPDSERGRPAHPTPFGVRAPSRNTLPLSEQERWAMSTTQVEPDQASDQRGPALAVDRMREAWWETGLRARAEAGT